MHLAQSTNWGHFPDRIGIYKCRGNPEYPGKNLSEQGREPTTSSTHI